MGISKFHFLISHNVDSVGQVSSFAPRSGSQPFTQYRGQIGLICSEHVSQAFEVLDSTVSPH